MLTLIFCVGLCRLQIIWTLRACLIWLARQWLIWLRVKLLKKFARHSTSRTTLHQRKRKKSAGKINGLLSELNECYKGRRRFFCCFWDFLFLTFFLFKSCNVLMLYAGTFLNPLSTFIWISYLCSQIIVLFKVINSYAIQITIVCIVSCWMVIVLVNQKEFEIVPF